MNKIIFLILTMWVVGVQAQVQVVESGSQTQARNRDTTSPNGGNELVISLYNQLETLQQEVQTLRGLVEEQAYLIKRLEAESKERYLDLDGRLTSLNSGAAGTNAPVAPTGAALTTGAAPAMGVVVDTPTGDVRTTVPFNPVPQAAAEPQESTPPTLPADDLSEQDLYRTALNMLLEEGKAADAVVLFQNYLDRYPAGRLLPNTLYWQGEAMILVAQYPQARDAFARVMNEFPEDPKAAGAMLKLGVVQNLMGDRALAEQTWRDLSIKYPDSTSELALAKDYLSKP
jgi:tol-pal system protein YbgF